MKEGFELEAEGGEIVIQNTNGDYAVIPKNKAAYINKLLNDGCHGCIDEFVATLPTMSDYAQEGTVVGDPLTPTSPSPPVPTTPYIQRATLNNINDWEAGYNERKTAYANNPQNNGVPVLGGEFRIPTEQERIGLIKYYESLSPNVVRNDDLEAYQSLLKNTYFVEGKPDQSGTFSKYIYEPIDIRKTYQSSNTVPNVMIIPSEPAPFVYTDPYTNQPLVEYTNKLRELGVPLPTTGTLQLAQGVDLSNPQTFANQLKQSATIEANKAVISSMTEEQKKAWNQYAKSGGSNKLTAEEWLKQQNGL